jgi:hypothetical protein
VLGNSEGSGGAAGGAVAAASAMTQPAALPWLPICVFALISGADTVSTLVLLQAGLMTEFNPVMNLILRHYGLTGFALAKLLLILIPASIFYRIALRRPVFVRNVVWVLNALYLLLYIVLFTAVNR